MSNLGYIHSIESFGASDGPGIRFVVFLKGCRLRCKYCHNPDTWGNDSKTEISADELLKKALRYKDYWKDKGGITVSGGEPLLQMDFLIELFKKAKENGVNTCIDTAGEPFNESAEFLEKFDELMSYTDLVLLDIKQMNPIKHKELTGADNENILQMAKYLEKIKKRVWLRYVLVPTLTDSQEDLTALKDFVSTLSNVERIDVLPYHTLGMFKWEELGIDYLLKDVPTPTPEQVKKVKEFLKMN